MAPCTAVPAASLLVLHALLLVSVCSVLPVRGEQLPYVCEACETVNLPKQPEVVPLTLVTGFFDFGNSSKHAAWAYSIWVKSFLSTVKTPIVGFVGEDEGSSSKMMMRGNLPAVWVKYPSLWDLPPVKGMHEFFRAQHEMDPERSIHHPELYGIWSSKTWLVAATAYHNPYSSRLFMWVDAGCFRDERHPFRYWPDVGRISRLLGGAAARASAEETAAGSYTYKPVVQAVDSRTSGFDLPDRIAMMWIGLLEQTDFPRLVADGQNAHMETGGLAATFFVGTANAVSWFNDQFWRVQREFKALGLFVGKEQPLFDMCLLQAPWRFAVLPMRRLDQTCHYGGLYFGFEYIVARANETEPSCLESSGDLAPVQLNSTAWLKYEPFTATHL